MVLFMWSFIQLIWCITLINCFNNLFYYLFIYLFLAALGLRCCVWAFSSCGERGLLFVVVHGLLLQWLLLMQSTSSRHVGSVVVACGL